ncbi:MAG: DUF1223 domain-containing protein [Deltaproteobacteria bacterium]|nr:DUF1223 domain-containing protein [Deltaproteobacteria bacterium]
MGNMRNFNALLTGFMLGAAAFPISAQGSDGQRFESSTTQTNLLELFSSEGCSSCPPADAWIANLREHPGLWKSFVPIEFHVDYWNRLGWTDRFSKDAFTGRQQQYAREWGNGNVYTPGFVLNGTEWRASGGDTRYANPNSTNVGVLVANQTAPSKFYVTFRPGLPGKNWKVYGALLGNGLTSEVRSGENNGKTLHHEFVVLSLANQLMDKAASEYTAVVELKTPRTDKAKSYSVAFWVTNENEQKPVQVVGGDLR